MKNKTTKTISIVAMFILFTSISFAQKKGMSEINIKTSSICDMCKDAIEKSLAFEKGVKKSNLDVKTKIVTVTYNPEKTTPEKIRLAISNTGYDADDIAANPAAYKKLDGCCKKGAVCNDKAGVKMETK